MRDISGESVSTGDLAPRYTDADLEPIRLALAALSDGDFRPRRVPLVSPNGSAGALAEISRLVDEVAGQLSLHASEVTQMAAQVRDIAQVATAVAKGDLSQKITVDAQGEMLQLKQTMNTMTSCPRSPTRSPESRARSAPKATSAARRTSAAPRGCGKTSPTR